MTPCVFAMHFGMRPDLGHIRKLFLGYKMHNVHLKRLYMYVCFRVSVSLRCLARGLYVHDPRGLICRLVGARMSKRFEKSIENIGFCMYFRFPFSTCTMRSASTGFVLKDALLRTSSDTNYY